MSPGEKGKFKSIITSHTRHFTNIISKCRAEIAKQGVMPVAYQSKLQLVESLVDGIRNAVEVEINS